MSAEEKYPIPMVSDDKKPLLGIATDCHRGFQFNPTSQGDWCEYEGMWLLLGWKKITLQKIYKLFGAETSLKILKKCQEIKENESEKYPMIMYGPRQKFDDDFFDIAIATGPHSGLRFSSVKNGQVPLARWGDIIDNGDSWDESGWQKTSIVELRASGFPAIEASEVLRKLKEIKQAKQSRCYIRSLPDICVTRLRQISDRIYMLTESDTEAGDFREALADAIELIQQQR